MNVINKIPVNKHKNTGQNMNIQKKKNSLIESTINTVIGLLTSFIIQIVLYPMLNIDVTINENIIITLVFFVVSIFRGYLVRRLFNRYVWVTRLSNS